MISTIKNIILTCVFALCLYAVFGAYIKAMFNGNLPMMKHNEPKEVCAVFPDGIKYNRSAAVSIRNYSKKSGQTFDYQPCK